MSLNKLKPLILFKLTDATNYTRWRNQLQDHLFFIFHNNDMDKLKTSDTLDPDFFKTIFPNEHKAASKDANGQKQDPLIDPDFLKMCTDHAFDTSKGFFTWLYSVYAEIRNALSDTIQEQTAGVIRGDLVSLLQLIKLSIHHYEINNPEAVDIEYVKCTMANCKQDVMIFKATLADYRRRLAAVGAAVSDAKAQRVLLNGLDEEIFENFVANALRTPYDSYHSLNKALEETAQQPRMLSNWLR
jgi:hypothetical protein